MSAYLIKRCLPEVLEVFGVHRGVGVDLKGEIVSTCVLEEAVHRIEELIRELEEPLPR